MIGNNFSYLTLFLIYYLLQCEVSHEYNNPVIAELPVQNVWYHLLMPEQYCECEITVSFTSTHN